MIPAIEIKWIDPPEVTPPPELVAEARGSLLLARALAQRGISTQAQARAFLDPACYRPALPTDLPDLDKGVERIAQAIRSGERIGVWGDFDVDGQTSTTLLVSVLTGLGGKVSYHIPVRAKESHGITLPYLKEFLDSGVQVLLTCDTGITAHEAVDYAKGRGVDVIITDHHSLPEVLPDAYAAINPQRLAEGHPLRTIPGVGTAYEFASELCARFGQGPLAEAQLDLVALGTVVDVATLTGDARYHVQRGLELLRQAGRPGLRKLYELAEVDPSHMTEEQIGFMIGPRMNALGRLDDAGPMVQFLTSEDPQFIATFAARLEGMNAERRVLVQQIFQGAVAQIEREPELGEQPALILAHPEWPAGVVGIVASRLVELFNRPVILLNAEAGKPMRGSARSIEGVNVTRAIAAAAPLLNTYGGHPMAAGLSFAPEKLAAVRRAIYADVARQVGAAPLVKEIRIDAYLDLPEIDLNLVADLERLAPFGPGNPGITLATRSLKVGDHTTLGKNADHLAVIVEDSQGNSRKVVWWNGSADLLPEGPFDLAYTVRANNYRGQPEVQLEWVSARIVAGKAVLAGASAAERYEILDLRDETDPQAALARIGAGPEVCLWAEGESDPGVDHFPRALLSKAGSLVIWNPPPERGLIRDALNKVAPQRVVLCAFGEYNDLPRAFLERLAGMLRYALRARQGKIVLNELAAALAQRETTVRTGLEWLVAKGFTRVVEETPGQVGLAEGGVPNAARLKEIEACLAAELQETASFRAFYRRADPASLLST